MVPSLLPFAAPVNPAVGTPATGSDGAAPDMGGFATMLAGGTVADTGAAMAARGEGVAPPMLPTITGEMLTIDPAPLTPPADIRPATDLRDDAMAAMPDPASAVVAEAAAMGAPSPLPPAPPEAPPPTESAAVPTVADQSAPTRSAPEPLLSAALEDAARAVPPQDSAISAAPIPAPELAGGPATAQPATAPVGPPTSQPDTVTPPPPTPGNLAQPATQQAPAVPPTPNRNAGVAKTAANAEPSEPATAIPAREPQPLPTPIGDASIFASAVAPVTTEVPSASGEDPSRDPRADESAPVVPSVAIAVPGAVTAPPAPAPAAAMVPVGSIASVAAAAPREGAAAPAAAPATTPTADPIADAPGDPFDDRAPDLRSSLDAKAPPETDRTGQEMAGDGRGHEGQRHAPPPAAAAPTAPVAGGLAPAFDPLLRGDAAAPVPTAPEAATARARAGTIGADVGLAITRHVERGSDDVLVIRLDPAELGRIEVRLKMDEARRLTADVTADQPATLDLLRRDSDNLSRALNDAGFRADGQSLRFDSRGSGQGDQPMHQGRRAASRAYRVDDAGTAPATPIPVQVRSMGRVDLVA